MHWVSRYGKRSRIHVADYVKLVYLSEERIESLNEHWSYYYQLFCSIFIFLGWVVHAWLSPRFDTYSHTYSTLIHIYCSKQWDSKKYYQRDLSSERPTDCSILELCRNIFILQQPYYCSVGLSPPYFSKNCIITTRAKCSVFKFVKSNSLFDA